MSLWFTAHINADAIATIEIRRVEPRGERRA